jgi:predicted transcriptional regulator
MSTKKHSDEVEQNVQEQKHKEEKRRSRSKTREPESESEEDVIDLCDDHDYQVLSAVLETEKGRNVAEILSKLQKDVHLLATSVSQLIQLSLAAQQQQQDEYSESD